MMMMNDNGRLFLVLIKFTNCLLIMGAYFWKLCIFVRYIRPRLRCATATSFLSLRIASKSAIASSGWFKASYKTPESMIQDDKLKGKKALTMQCSMFFYIWQKYHIDQEELKASIITCYASYLFSFLECKIRLYMLTSMQETLDVILWVID